MCFICNFLYSNQCARIVSVSYCTLETLYLLHYLNEDGEESMGRLFSLLKAAHMQSKT